jgi:hypothetical protein
MNEDVSISSFANVDKFFLAKKITKIVCLASSYSFALLRMVAESPKYCR